MNSEQTEGTCARCGTKLELRSSFCIECGARVQPESLADEQATEEEKGKSGGVSLGDDDLRILRAYFLLEAAKKAANGLMLRGVAWAAAGVIITWIAYSMAEPGDTYLVFWGLCIYGAIQFLRGIYFRVNPEKLIEKASNS